MTDNLLIRDVMRIGVPTCKLGDPLAQVAALMLDGNHTALIVLDEEGDTRGWINERMLGAAYARLAAGSATELVASDVMDEHVPDCQSDLPLAVAAGLMADLGVDHLFFLHRGGGRLWPASLLSQRDLVRAIAGHDYLAGQGHAAPRPTPLDLYRQRYGLPPAKR